ncbi:MAG: HIT family protein [Brevinematales bacterium]|nr:HIT family protein [Brevinematales bacterium]
MSSECIFCKIAAGEEHACRIFEDDISIAFLDMRPVFYGHTLLIPKKHFTTIMEFPDDMIYGFFCNLKLISRAVEDAMGSQGIFNAINNRISQSVPHLHIHILPRSKGDGMRHFLWPRKQYENMDEAMKTADHIRRTIGRLKNAPTE